MKKVALMLLVLFSLQSCKGSTTKNTKSSTDTDKVMEDLEGILEAVKTNDYETLKSKYLVTQDDIQDFAINYGMQTSYWRSRYGVHLKQSKVRFFQILKEKIQGTNLNTKDIKANYLIADKYTTLKGLKRRKITLIFGNGSKCYQMELYLISHNGKRLYTFKGEIDPMKEDLSSYKSSWNSYLKKFKKDKPNEYKEMIFEEY